MTSHWDFFPTVPPDWADSLRICEGTFFHTPAALPVSFPLGTPFYARRRNGSGVDAVAMGVAASCRFSIAPRHYTSATTPAAAPGTDAQAVSLDFSRELAQRGAAEVTVQSFGARCLVGNPSACGAQPGRARIEFEIPLSGSTEADIAARFSSMHRRHIKRGERDGWVLQNVTGAAARELLYAGQGTAAERAHLRGEGFAVRMLSDDAVSGLFDPTHAWGTTCMAVIADGAPLSVALIGWANGHGVYLAGGSTQLGYKQSAAFWMQWKIMSLLARNNFVSYNLGGVPAEGEDAAHSSHGLFQYKTGFGAELIKCQGSRWVFRPQHVYLHSMVSRLKQALRPGGLRGEQR